MSKYVKNLRNRIKVKFETKSIFSNENFRHFPAPHLHKICIKNCKRIKSNGNCWKKEKKLSREWNKSGHKKKVRSRTAPLSLRWSAASRAFNQSADVAKSSETSITVRKQIHSVHVHEQQHDTIDSFLEQIF